MTCVISEKDAPATFAALHWLAEAAKAGGTHAIDRVVTGEVSHLPFVSQSEWTVEMLEEQAVAL